MKYRAIIVDDESIVREGLRKHFNWEKYSVSIDGCFEDGKQAWDFLMSHEVDIIITDVRMAHMDGVTLAQKAVSLYPDINILFISGYADVEYLRDALKIEAIDYILKSVDLTELASTIERTINKIRKKRAELEKLQIMEQKLEMSLPLLRRQVLLGILRENEDALPRELNTLDISLDNDSWYCIAILRLSPPSRLKFVRENTEKNRVLIGLKIEELCTDIMSEYGKCVVCNDRFIEYILIVPIKPNQYEERCFASLRRLQTQIASEYSLDTVIGMSEAFQRLNKLHHAYLNSCKALEQGYLIEENIPVSISKYRITDTELLLKDTEQNIRSSLLTGELPSILQTLTAALHASSQIQSAQELENWYLTLLLIPCKTAAEIRGIRHGSYSCWDRLLINYLSCDNMADKEKLLFCLYEEFADGIRESGKPLDNAAIQRVTDMINTKYMDQLSVITLSDLVNLTPAYLCVLFRQKTGMTINEYITQTRMEKAKEILSQTQLHLYEVCYQVGYLSPAYFSRLFKKYTGQTPKEWRDKH